MTNQTIPFPLNFQLQELLNLTDEVLFAFHLGTGRFIYLNAAFDKVWQVPRAGIIANMSLLINTVHRGDRAHVADVFAALQNTRESQTAEFRIQPPGEAQKWIKVNAYVSRNNNTDVVVGIATDFTAERSYSDALHKFNEKKNTILQILSHDLLSPLSNIEMATHLLAENSILNEDKPVMKILDIISQSSKRSVEMIKDLISDEFLQSSEAAFVKQRVDLVKKMIIMMEQFGQSPRAIQNRFRFTSSAKSLYVHIDESKFMQAVNNLISNALKFTPDEGYVEVNLSEPDEKSILITIKDNGIGIPANMQPFLFDRFTKARRIGIHGEPTNGLGMSIIKTIIEWHKGKVWFESTEGKGSTFYVQISKDR